MNGGGDLEQAVVAMAKSEAQRAFYIDSVSDNPCQQYLIPFYEGLKG